MTSISRRSFLVGSTAMACSLPAFASEPDNKFDESADVVVVGLGGAGAAAAITAADHKASVIILEKQPLATLRSNTRMSGGWVHCPDKDGNKEELRRYFRAYSPLNTMTNLQLEKKTTSRTGWRNIGLNTHLT